MLSDHDEQSSGDTAAAAALSAVQRQALLATRTFHDVEYTGAMMYGLPPLVPSDDLLLSLDGTHLRLPHKKALRSQQLIPPYPTEMKRAAVTQEVVVVASARACRAAVVC